LLEYSLPRGEVVDQVFRERVLGPRNAGNRIELFQDGVSLGQGTGAQAGGAITTDLRALGSERYWVVHGPAHGPAYLPGAVDEFASLTAPWTPRKSAVWLAGNNDAVALCRV
jgi:hypothetical protein